MMTEPVSPKHSSSNQTAPRSRIVWVLVVGLTLIGVTLVSPAAMLVVLEDGAPAAAICICAMGLGIWIVRAIGLHAAPLRWRWMLSLTLGLGTLSLLVLVLGLLGVLQSNVWICILLASLVAGIARIKYLRRNAFAVQEPSGDRDAGWMRLLWLAVVPFAVLALLGATIPPGVLWPAEGNGYDVLEYHLGVPREYLEAGEITYLPHNIYSNFPFAVEMLYLLSMVLHGNALAGVFTAKLLNVLLGVLAVGGAWLAAREVGPRAGVAAGVTMASFPILTYLSGIAYVEHGMLAFTAMAVASTIRAFRMDPGERVQWCVVAGLLAGFACGCKYTAIPMVALPLGFALSWLAIRSRRRAWIGAAAFGVAVLLTFGPWLVKNSVYTGNPVFPLARSVFPERAGIWDDERAAHWHDGHLPAPEDRPIGRQLSRVWFEVLSAGATETPPAGKRVPEQQALLGSALYGPMPLLAILAGAACTLYRRRHSGSEPNRGVAVAWIVLAATLITWLGFTHLAGRFAISIVVPLAVLMGVTVEALSRNRRMLGAAVVIMLGAAAWNFSTIYRIFTPADTPYLEVDLFGRIDIMQSGNSPHIAGLNERLREGHRILIVADARRLYLEPGADYHVVFNRNPFAEAAAAMTPDELLDWLRSQGYEYVYVDWVEMWRLRGSRYGFWPSITVDLFERLTEHGLIIEEHYHTLGFNKPYGTLFRVPAG